MRQEVLGNAREVVSAVQQGLAAGIGRERFELWFGSGVQWAFVEGTLYITAPNSFLLDRLKRQFARDLRRTVQTICGQAARVEFRVGEEAPQRTAAEGTSPNPDGSSSAASAPRSPSLPSASASAAAGPASVVKRGEPRSDLPRPAGPHARRESLATYIVGDGNRVAYTATESIVRRPGVVSPLFLYGPVGSGKSHLLEAACAATRAGSSRAHGAAPRALLLSAEQFTSLFLEALQGSGLPNFRRKCREVDLLAIDDIHFFAGKRATRLEFQHTMDALARQGRQLIVAADRPPAELSVLGPELVTRLTGGLVCGIEPADYETRLGIARQIMAREELSVPDSVAQLIARETSGDARQVRGALNRLRATSDARRQPVSLELAQEALADIFAATQRLVRLPDVERAVCEVFGMESHALRDGAKTKSISQPRMLAMWLARKYTRAAFSEIGEYFGRRSHSTVISAEQKVNRWMADGVKLQLGRSAWSVDEAIRRIETKLRTG